MLDIKGYEDLYAVTSCGRVWSYRAKRFLKPLKGQNDYLYVNLYKDGKQKHHRIHRLVAETYLPNPLNLPQVNHKDENKANNALPNLEWISHKDNCNFGTRNDRIAKACQKRVICIETGQVFESIKEAQDFFKCGHNIARVCKGKRKTAAGLHWRYYD